MYPLGGDWAISGKWHSGVIDGICYENIFVECRLGHPDYWKDDVFFPDGNRSKHKSDEESARYLKKCVEIIKTERSKNKKTTFIILSRTSRHFFSKIDLINAYIDFSKNETEVTKTYFLNNKKRKEFYDELDRSIEVLTAHKSKWKEADVCILLQVWKKSWSSSKFPMIHPDWEFSTIFGDTYEDILDEERRLYYVALTRTKKDLYYISMGEIPEKVKKEDFLLGTFKC